MKLNSLKKKVYELKAYNFNVASSVKKLMPNNNDTVKMPSK